MATYVKNPLPIIADLLGRTPLRPSGHAAHAEEAAGERSAPTTIRGDARHAAKPRDETRR